LHASVAAAVHQRNKLERLCRYITRPPVAIERISLTPQGNLRYALKTPYRDGTTGRQTPGPGGEGAEGACPRSWLLPSGALGVALFEKPSARRLRMSGESMTATEST
jgi:hypothetical protein